MGYVFLFGGLLLLLATVVVVSVFRGSEATTDEPPERLPPGRRQEAALEALRRVEFDYRTGKLPEEEYRELRERYGRIALEGRSGSSGARPPESGSGAKASGRGAIEGDPASTGGRAAVACPVCRTPTAPSAAFCERCGARLERAAEKEGP